LIGYEDEPEIGNLEHTSSIGFPLSKVSQSCLVADALAGFGHLRRWQGVQEDDKAHSK